MPDRYLLDDDPQRIQPEAVWRMLSTQAYWGRWREYTHFTAQLATAWRVVGAYERTTGAQVGFARAVSDGVAFAYLADVIVDEPHRGAGLGKGLIRTMIEDGPGADFRWTLFTADAHGLYRGFGFAPPDDTALVRPAAPGMR